MNWRWLLLGLILTTAMAVAEETKAPFIKTSPSAVESLLQEAKRHFDATEYEQSAAVLERALRIEPRNPVLWHNLAGVRLKQEDWARSASLAAKSNSFSVEDKWLRVRNWVVIALACEGMKNNECTKEARKRAWALAN